MNILYMGYFCNEELFNNLVNKGSKSSHARQQFERKLLCGLTQNIEGHKLQLISYLPLVDGSLATTSGEVYQGCEISYLWCRKKIFSIIKAVMHNVKAIRHWAKSAEKERVILTYSANPLHCIPAMLLRRKYNYKVVTISSEISIYRRKTTRNLFALLQEKLSFYLENNFDGYVLLSKYMNEVVNVDNKPYIVVEGFAEPIDNVKFDVTSDDRQNAILYAGGLSEDNGIKLLVEGFKKLVNTEFELWICGDGQLADYIKEQANNNEHIKYFGIMPNDKVRILEGQAKFLINPRFSGEDYTKYSFPSKTLEYMSTGTPAILTRLKGIPEEYFDNVMVLEDETVDGIVNLFEQIDTTSYECFWPIGEKAMRFVLENKTPERQGKKILEFLSSL